MCGEVGDYTVKGVNTWVVKPLKKKGSERGYSTIKVR